MNAEPRVDSDGAVYLGDQLIGYVATDGRDWWARISQADSHRVRFASDSATRRLSLQKMKGIST